VTSLLNIQRWHDIEKRAKAQLKTRATIYVRSRIKKVFEDAIKVSPQWSGNYAANWTIETNATGVVGYNSALKVNPWTNLQWWDTAVTGVTKEQAKWASASSKPRAKHVGAPRALKFARDQFNEKLLSVKWNTKVRIVNKSPVAELLDTEQVNLRKVNLIPGHTGVMSYLKAKHTFLD